MATLYGETRYVFLVSHMRGYTTLLAHLLGSHPQVRGYAEQHRSYESLGALKALRRNLERERFAGKRKQGGFLLDKLLNDDLGLADFIAASPNVYIIFTLREPLATLRSIIANIGFLADEADAVGYYLARLAYLRAMPARLGLTRARTLYFDAERLLDTSAATLATLSSFLGLQEPPGERYDLFTHTGERGFGDASPRLRSGRIVDAAVRRSGSLSAESVQQAMAAYRACRATLLERFAR